MFFTYDTLPDGRPHVSGVGYYRNSTQGFYFDSSMLTCYHSENSTAILLGTTDKLSGNTVLAPIKYLSENAWALNNVYSINVKQYGLSQEAFAFYSKMKKNSESLGSIFDAQPSELQGNIFCTTDPDEEVIGFVAPCSVEQKRIFIRVAELPGWLYSENCAELVTGADTQESVDTLVRMNYLPVEVRQYGGPGLVAYYAGPALCVDCRLRGSGVKPDFWP
jgi:hypothetical protein